MEIGDFSQAAYDARIGMPEFLHGNASQEAQFIRVWCLVDLGEQLDVALERMGMDRETFDSLQSDWDTVQGDFETVGRDLRKVMGLED